MNKGMLTVGIIVLAVMSLLVINVISNYSTSNEVDYYLVKETSEAAMTDALDEEFRTLHGIPRIDKEKYIESFIRRFADNANQNRSYDIAFYGLNEVPPKVTVRVDSLTTVGFTNGDGGHVSTSINQMAESSQTTDNYLKCQFNSKASSIGSPVDLKYHTDAKYNEIIPKK